MITFTEYVEYFEGLASKFKSIGHSEATPRFAILDIDDIIGSQRTNLDFTNPVLILENPEGELSWIHNQLADTKYGAFHILKNVPRNDPAKKKLALDECQALGQKLIARMQYEKIDQHSKGVSSLYPVMLRFFVLDRSKYNKVGPIFNDCFGWRFEFEFAQQTPLPFDSDDWTDFDE